MFKLILDSIVWGYKHTMRNVNDTGLEIMLQLLKNVESRGAQGQERVLSLICYSDILYNRASIIEVILFDLI